MILCILYALFGLFPLLCHVAADNLIFVQVIWRHGYRAPSQTFPTDINQADKWPQGWSQLTSMGMQQQYALGTVLRTKYNGFVSSTYKTGEIYVRSTDVDRSLMSAMSNMAGFYPTGNVGINYPDQNAVPRWPTQWTPVPIHTVERSTDYIGDSFESCPRGNHLYDQILKNDFYRKISLEHQQLFDFLTSKAGYNVTLDTIWIIKEALFIEKIHKMAMSTWLNDTLYQQIVAVNNIAEDFLFGIGPNNSQVPQTEEIIRLRGGSILKAITDNMQLKLFCIENPSNSTCRSFRTLKYYAYSANDVTVGALLTTFGSYQQIVGSGLPQYAATVAVELWNTSSGPQVKILYNSGVNNQTFYYITNKIQGCQNSDYCPFRTFLNRSQQFFLKDTISECHAELQTPTATKSPVTTKPFLASTSNDTNNHSIQTQSFMLLAQIISDNQHSSKTPK